MNVCINLWDAHPGHEAPVPPHPKDALLGWDLVTVGTILLQWTHCHVQETNLKWFEPIWNQFEMIILLEVAIRGWVHGGYKGMDMVRNNAQVGRGI